MAKRSRLDGKTLRTYAKLGAQARLADIKRELTEMLKTFPEIFRRSGPGGVPGGRVPNPIPKARRKRRKLTAAERKASGLRMKKYWAERRKRTSR